MDFTKRHPDCPPTSTASTPSSIPSTTFTTSTTSTTSHKIKTVQFNPLTRNIFLHLLTNCNLSCRHCYINKEAHGSTPIPLDELKRWLSIFAMPELTAQIEEEKGQLWNRAGNAVSDYKERSVESTNIIFLGGEPTLYPFLKEAVIEARSLGYRSITVDTNGFLFNDFLDRISCELIDNICFSLDGSAPYVNDYIRGKGCYETCVSNIKKAVNAGFNVSVIFTVSTMNIDDLSNMPALLEGLGVRRFFIQVIGIRGRSRLISNRNFSGQNDNGCKNTQNGIQVAYEKWLEIIPEVALDVAQRGISVSYPKVYLKENEEFLCGAVYADNYFVFPNGRVYICPLCEDYPINAYKITKNGLIIRPPITELDLVGLDISEGCVMNKILHPDNIPYDDKGIPRAKIACCMFKEEIEAK